MRLLCKLKFKEKSHMKNKSFIFLGLALLFGGAMVLSACGRSSTDNSNTPSVESSYSEPSGSESGSSDSSNIHVHKTDNEWIYDEHGHYHVCKECGEKVDFTEHNLSTRTTTVEHSCTTVGYDGEETYCIVCGYVQGMVRKNIVDVAQHEFEIVKEVKATCTTSGYVEYKCKSCDESYTEIYKPLGHDWVEGEHCTDLMTCKSCGVTKPGLGHHYHVESEVSMNCTTDGKTVYHCENCDDEYTVIKKSIGHVFENELEFSKYEEVEGKDCTYHVVYHGTCTVCGEDVYVTGTDEVTKHNLVTKYEKYPTCTETGIKGNYCTVCEQFIANKEVVPVDPTVHNWELLSDTNGVVTYQCSDCNETKSVVFFGSNYANASSDSLANNEVALTSASLKFDGLDTSSDNLSLSLENVSSYSLYHLDYEDYNKIKNSPIYDFKLVDESNNDVNFNKVLVRIPYTLRNGEDPDAIVVYYIDDSGSLQEIAARYNDGYAIFETEHFSIYCVTFMSPAERCEKFGHNWSDTYEIVGTCLTDGFKYHYCSRCNKLEKFDYVTAEGHKYIENTSGSHDATCTSAGHTDYVCSVCGDSYGTDLPALGHNYVLDEEHSIEATCDTGGRYIYTCDKCSSDEPGHVYELTTAAVGHRYVTKTTPATCLKEGSVVYVCSVCGEEDDSQKVVLEKTEHKFVLDSEDTSKFVYKCEGCGAVKEIAKVTSANVVTVDSAKEDKLFTNLPISMVDTSVSATGGLNLEIENNYGLNKYNYDGAEIFIGLDENNMLTAYGKMDVDQNHGTGVTYAFYLKNNMLYTVSSGNYYAMDLDNYTVYGDILKNVPNILDFIKNDVKKYYDSLVEIKGDKVNELSFNILNSLFDFQPSVEGFNIRFSSAKMSELLKTLKTGTLREAIEFVIGKGNVDKLIDRISEYSDVSYKKALSMFKEDTGIDYKELLELLDKGVAKFSKYESLRELILDIYNVDIDEYLNDDYLSSHTLVNLVKDNNYFVRLFSNNTIAEFIEKYIRQYLGKKMSEIIDNEKAYENFLNVVDNIEGISKKSEINFRFKDDGSLLGIDVNVDAKEEVAENVFYTIKGNLEINFNTKLATAFDYSGLKNFTDRVLSSVYHDGGFDKDLASSFSTDHELIKNSDGLITGVKYESSYGPGYYYDGYNYPTSKDDEDYDRNIIRSKKDAIYHRGSSYYDELVDLIEKNGLTNRYIKIENEGSVYQYHTNDIKVSTINFRRSCGNNYEVKISYGIDCDATYNVAFLKLFGSGSMPIKTVELKGDSYSYKSINNLYNVTYNSVTGKLNGPQSEHEWIFSESLSNYKDVKCGEDATYVYTCANCGTKRTSRSHVNHEHCEVVKAEFNDNIRYPYCEYGVRVTYKCSDCGDTFEQMEYNHVVVDKEEYSLEELGISNKLIVEKCLCGRSNNYLIEGFTRKLSNAYAGDRYYDYIFESNELVDGKALYIGIDYEYYNDYEHCKRIDYLTITTNIYDQNSLNRLVTTITLDEHEAHSFDTSYVKTSALVPTDANDLSKGFDVIYHCYNCDETLKKHYSSNDYVYSLMIDVGNLPPASDRIHVEGRAIDIYRGYISGIQISYMSGYSTSVKTLDDGTILYEYFKEGVEGKLFKYTIKYNVQEHDSVTCKDYVCDVYGFGCDEEGKNPIATYKHIRSSQTSHILDNDKVVETKEYNSLGIAVVIESGKCQDCGKNYANSYIDRKDKDIYTEEQVVTEGDVTTTYPVGYSPKTETIDYDPSSVNDGHSYYGDYCIDDAAVVILNGKTITKIQRYFRIDSGDYVVLCERESVYDLNYNEIEMHETKKFYHYQNGLDYTTTNVKTKYSPHINEEAFKAKFKECFKFDYDVNEFGCISFYEYQDEYVGSDGTTGGESYIQNINYQDHANTTHHDGTCTQLDYYECEYCGEVKSVSESPYGHDFDWDDEKQIYVCSRCGTTSYSSYSYSYYNLLEDCSSLDKTGKKIILGYYLRDYYYDHYYDELKEWSLSSYEYELKINLIGSNSDDLLIEGVDVEDTGDHIKTHYLEINKADLVSAIEKAIAKSGNKYKYVEFSLVKDGYSYSDCSMLFTLNELGVEYHLDNTKTYTIKVTDSNSWGKMYVYAWSEINGIAVTNADWPGVALTKGVNGYGEVQFSGKVPVDAEYFIITAGDGNKNHQTATLSVSTYFGGKTGCGFYWDNGKLMTWSL